LLVEDRPRRYHYVVAIGVGSDEVIVHDPALGPARRVRSETLLRAWTPTGFWSLVVTPGAAHEKAVPIEDSTRPASDDPVEWHLAELAGIRFAEKQFAEAARLAKEALNRDPRDGYAWDVLGSSRFVSGDRLRALDAWRQIGRPRIDTIRIQGA